MTIAHRPQDYAESGSTRCKDKADQLAEINRNIDEMDNKISKMLTSKIPALEEDIKTGSTTRIKIEACEKILSIIDAFPTFNIEPNLTEYYDQVANRTKLKLNLLTVVDLLEIAERHKDKPMELDALTLALDHIEIFKISSLELTESNIGSRKLTIENIKERIDDLKSIKSEP